MNCQTVTFMPRFSIVIPCRNAQATLRETIVSLQAQRFDDWEALLIDDGSTDGTLALIEATVAADPRFRAVRNGAKGPGAARNMALSLARGEILAFCDADDLFEPSKLPLMDRIFEDRSIAAAFGRVVFFDGTHSRSHSGVPRRDLDLGMLLGENPVCTTSNVCVRAEVFRATGGFDTAIMHNEDLEWLIRVVGEGYRVVPIDALMVAYRISPTGLSADLAAMRAGWAAAMATAGRYGVTPTRAAEAVQLRYLARRALRVDAPRTEALRLTCAGIGRSPSGFFSDPRRGGLTALSALAAPVMPRRLRRALFIN